MDVWEAVATTNWDPIWDGKSWRDVGTTSREKGISASCIIAGGEDSDSEISRNLRKLCQEVRAGVRPRAWTMSITTEKTDDLDRHHLTDSRIRGLTSRKMSMWRSLALVLIQVGLSPAPSAGDQCSSTQATYRHHLLLEGHPHLPNRSSLQPPPISWNLHSTPTIPRMLPKSNSCKLKLWLYAPWLRERQRMETPSPNKPCFNSCKPSRLVRSIITRLAYNKSRRY